MRQIIIMAIKAYQKAVSPYIIKRCRFEPTCSQYAVEAVETLGAAKGGVKALWRILRCNPFSRGGYDPVREKSNHQTKEDNG